MASGGVALEQDGPRRRIDHRQRGDAAVRAEAGLVARSAHHCAMARLRRRGARSARLAERPRRETTCPGLQFIYTTDDGDEVWTTFAAAPFRNLDGDVVGAVAGVEDVSEQKRSAQREQMRRANRTIALLAVIQAHVLGCGVACAGEGEIRGAAAGDGAAASTDGGGGWGGTSLAEVVRSELEAFVSRARIEGPRRPRVRHRRRTSASSCTNAPRCVDVRRAVEPAPPCTSPASPTVAATG